MHDYLHSTMCIYLFFQIKLVSHIRREITEARLLKIFKKLFGGPKDAIIITIGDFK